MFEDSINKKTIDRNQYMDAYTWIWGVQKKKREGFISVLWNSYFNPFDSLAVVAIVCTVLRNLFNLEPRPCNFIY